LLEYSTYTFYMSISLVKFRATLCYAIVISLSALLATYATALNLARVLNL